MLLLVVETISTRALKCETLGGIFLVHAPFGHRYLTSRNGIGNGSRAPVGIIHSSLKHSSLAFLALKWALTGISWGRQERTKDVSGVFRASFD